MTKEICTHTPLYVQIEWEFNTTKFERGRVAIQHHEAIELPNGNILYLLWVVKDYAEAIQAGRDPARDVPDNQNKSGYLLTEEIVEVKPLGKKSAEEVWRKYTQQNYVCVNHAVCHH